jgi:hypothetical protein
VGRKSTATSTSGRGLWGACTGWATRGICPLPHTPMPYYTCIILKDPLERESISPLHGAVLLGLKNPVITNDFQYNTHVGHVEGITFTNQGVKATVFLDQGIKGQERFLCISIACNVDAEGAIFKRVERFALCAKSGFPTATPLVWCSPHMLGLEPQKNGE